MNSSGRSMLGLLAAGLLLFGLALLMRVQIVDAQAERRLAYSIKEEAIESPGPRAMALLSLEHAKGVADLIWLQIVQILGGEVLTSAGVGDRIERWSNLASDADPRYYTIYYAGGIHLAVYAQRVESADRLLLKGTKNLPERWELPYLLGYNAYFMRGDPKLAAKYWLESSKLPNVPRVVPSLVARSTYQSGAEQEAIAILETFIATTTGPIRADAEIRLKLFKSEKILTLYDEQCAFIRMSEGHMPTPKEVFDRGLVAYPPKDLLDKDIYYDRQCRARTEVITLREDEAAERIGMFGEDRDSKSRVRIDVHRGNK